MVLEDCFRARVSGDSAVENRLSLRLATSISTAWKTSLYRRYGSEKVGGVFPAKVNALSELRRVDKG
jgi:hypothetical protein